MRYKILSQNYTQSPRTQNGKGGTKAKIKTQADKEPKPTQHQNKNKRNHQTHNNRTNKNNQVHAKLTPNSAEQQPHAQPKQAVSLKHITTEMNNTKQQQNRNYQTRNREMQQMTKCGDSQSPRKLQGRKTLQHPRPRTNHKWQKVWTTFEYIVSRMCWPLSGHRGMSSPGHIEYRSLFLQSAWEDLAWSMTILTCQFEPCRGRENYEFHHLHLRNIRQIIGNSFHSTTPLPRSDNVWPFFFKYLFTTSVWMLESPSGTEWSHQLDWRFSQVALW